MKRSLMFILAAAFAAGACSDQQDPSTSDTAELASTAGTSRVNVLLKAKPTAANRTELSKHGTIYDEIAQINVLLMRVKGEKIAAIRALPFVAGVSMDAVRDVGPIPAIPAGIDDFAAGTNVWNLDAVNVTDHGSTGRKVGFTGDKVYVAILDTGLLPSWRSYFPEDRIASQYAKTFGGGGAANNEAISEPPNKWEQDVNSHGTHVASIVLGFQYRAASSGPLQIAGVAPKATVIPVKVLNQNGSGWSSAIAQGITYIADLAGPKGPLKDKRVVINMSLGGSQLDNVERIALDYALLNNVVVVASAGNSGPDGFMGYPGAYNKVISVAAAGWTGEWNNPPAPATPAPNCSKLPGTTDALLESRFWRQCDVPEGYDEKNYYITDFSAEANPAASAGPQDLDVAAPGSWVVGPWQEQQGTISYFFIGGTSQAAPHVAGMVALLLEKYPALPAAQVEGILEQAANDRPLPDVNQQVRPGTNPNPFILAPLPDWGIEGQPNNRGGHGFLTADAVVGVGS
jgi:subtilisin family serine protease